MQYNSCPVTLEVLEHILFEKKKLEHILNDQMSKLNHRNIGNKFSLSFVLCQLWENYLPFFKKT